MDFIMLGVKFKPCTVHVASDIEAIFADVFYVAYQTVLIGGATEPLYMPANQQGENNTIYYREDFFASALHEVSHWCIAGKQRRQQIDFAYWYVDDGRNEFEQEAFEAVEVKPQALELLFSLAANYPFQVSADNLIGGAAVPTDFKSAVFEQARYYCDNGLPKRAEFFYRALSAHFNGMSIAESAAYLLTQSDS